MKNGRYLLISCWLLFSSCAKDDTYSLTPASPEFLLTAADYKKWEMIDPSVTLEMNKPLPVTMPACPNAEVINGLGYFYHIYANGTVEFQDGCGKTSTDRTLLKGTWVFSGDKKNITVTIPGLTTQIWTIIQLTVSRLVINTNGATLTFAPTPYRSS